MRRPQAAALLFLLTLTASVHAENKPARGSWRRLAVRREVLAPDARLADLDRRTLELLRAFQPSGAKVESLSVLPPEGEQPLRLSFRATTRVNVDVGPIPVSSERTVTVRARVTSARAACGPDPAIPGFRYMLDLRESDEPLAANADALVVAVCATAEPNVYEVATYMQVGPDYGTRVAGRVATDLLTRQTDGFVHALHAVVDP